MLALFESFSEHEAESISAGVQGFKVARFQRSNVSKVSSGNVSMFQGFKDMTSMIFSNVWIICELQGYRVAGRT
jgi:hypothetical protein